MLLALQLASVSVFSIDQEILRLAEKKPMQHKAYMIGRTSFHSGANPPGTFRLLNLLRKRSTFDAQKDCSQLWLPREPVASRYNRNTVKNVKLPSVLPWRNAAEQWRFRARLHRIGMRVSPR